MIHGRANVYILCGYVFGIASNTIDIFDAFNIFELIDFLIIRCFSITYVCPDVWHGSCFGERCDASN